MSVQTAGLSLTEFTASDLPTKKWMRWICPKMRLRVRTQIRDFVSPAVKVDDRSWDTTDISSVYWPWRGDEQSLQPSFADDDDFEVQVERRFLLRYKCIRRTTRMSIDQIRTGDHCALPLYDGRMPVEMVGDRIEMGEITFTVRSDATGEGASYMGTTSTSMYSEKADPHAHEGHEQRRRVFWRA